MSGNSSTGNWPSALAAKRGGNLQLSCGGKTTQFTKGLGYLHQLVYYPVVVSSCTRVMTGGHNSYAGKILTDYSHSIMNIFGHQLDSD